MLSISTMDTIFSLLLSSVASVLLFLIYSLMEYIIYYICKRRRKPLTLQGYIDRLKSEVGIDKERLTSIFK